MTSSWAHPLPRMGFYSQEFQSCEGHLGWRLLTLQQQLQTPLSCHTSTVTFHSKLRNGRAGALPQRATTRRLQALLPGAPHKHITELTTDYVSMAIFELLHPKASSSGLICTLVEEQQVQHHARDEQTHPGTECFPWKPTPRESFKYGNVVDF